MGSWTRNTGSALDAAGGLRNYVSNPSARSTRSCTVPLHLHNNNLAVQPTRGAQYLHVPTLARPLVEKLELGISPAIGEAKITLKLLASAMASASLPSRLSPASGLFACLAASACIWFAAISRHPSLASPVPSVCPDPSVHPWCWYSQRASHLEGGRSNAR